MAEERENEELTKRFALNIGLCGENATAFNSVKNKSNLAKELINKHYDCTNVTINVAEDILQKFKNDVNRPFLIDVLLTSYYNGDIDCNSLSVIRNKSNDLGKSKTVRQEYVNENNIVSEEVIVNQEVIVKELAIDKVETKEDMQAIENQVVEDGKEESVVVKEEVVLEPVVEEVKTIEEGTTLNKGKLNIGHSTKPKVSLIGLNTDNVPKTS